MSDEQTNPRTFTNVNEFMYAAWGSRDDQGRAEHSELYDQVGARLFRLHDAVHGAIGQLVLVIERKVETMGCGGMMPRRLAFPRTEESYTLGILNEPGLTLCVDRGNVLEHLRGSLVTTGHVRAWRGMGRWCTRLEPGPIMDDVLNSFWLHLDTPTLQVIAGDNAVFAWAEREGREFLLRDMADLLGRGLWFPALEKRITRERLSLAAAVDTLWFQREMLRRSIDRVVRAAQKGNILALGGALTFCETPEDAVFITARDRERLQECEDRLRAHLQKLVEFGLTDASPNIHLIRHVAQQLGIALT